MADPREAAARVTIDRAARDYDAILGEMRRIAPTVLPEWSAAADESDFATVLLELFAHMGDVLGYYQDRVAAESYLGTARSRRSVIDHLGLIGYSLGTAAPARTVLTITVPDGAEGTATVNRGDAFATTSTPMSPSLRFTYTGPAKLVPLGPDAPRTFELPVEEGRLLVDELIGTSDGTPDQRFALGQAPLIRQSRGLADKAADDVVLVARHTEAGLVHEEIWTLRPTLAFSPPTPDPVRDPPGRVSQRDFTVEIDAEDRAVVMFGDGTFGAVPVAGDTLYAAYRVGGGIRGNVGAGQITTHVGQTDLSRIGARVTNLIPATGGAERESADRAVRTAPAVFRSLGRAVTAADYEAIALAFPGVGKVRAVAGTWNAVTLYVALDGGGELTDVHRDALRAYFEDVRPISVAIDFLNVVPLKVYVAASVDVLPYYAATEVEDEVRRAAAAVLDFANVDFGRPIYLSRFYEVIEAVPGVAGAVITEFRPDQGEGQPPVVLTGKIAPSGAELPQAGYPDWIVLQVNQ